MINFIDG